jgi:penicillin-binding protein 2
LKTLVEKRSYILRWTIIVIFSIILFRLLELQVVRGAIYQELSERNRIRQIPVSASRGVIVDRQGNILVNNRPSYCLFIVPFEYMRNPVDAEIASNILNISNNEIEKLIQKSGNAMFTPIKLIRDLDFETLSNIEENKLDLPGVFYNIETVRTYSPDIEATHLLGYLGEINRLELNSLQKQGYRLGDLIGRSGIERYFEYLLKGYKGYRYVEVDARGREVGNFGGKRDIAPKPGKNIMLTLDSELQKLAETYIEEGRGSIVVLNPQNGEILAMVSKPDYNLEEFTNGLSFDRLVNLQSNLDKPFLNRTTQAMLEPGSTFKLVLAAAALEENIVDPDEKYICQGEFILGNKVFHCWRPEGHETVNMVDAIMGSCNVYFWNLGLKISIDKIAHYGKHFGFGTGWEMDLSEESTGILPDRQFLNKKYGKNKWGKGTILNLSVGQGDLLVTPIQMVMMASIIGSEGMCGDPHLLRSVQDPSGKWQDKSLNIKRINGISSETYKILKQGMSGTVNLPGGTGNSAWIHGVEVCGKTGTAQNPQGEDHAWFVGFAPRDNPIIAIAVVIENGGSGGSIAAPIAGRIFRWYFNRENAT